MPTLEDHYFNLRYASKDLLRQHKQCLKKEKEEKLKLKKALTENDLERSRVYAENAIRQKTQGQNLLRISSRIDAIAQRVQMASSTHQVTRSMSGVVDAMNKAMKSMNLEQVTSLMDNFEKQFENLDIQSNVLQDSMSNSTNLSIPQESVDVLLQQVADENGLEIKMDLPNADPNPPSRKTESSQTQEEEDLMTRLAKLRQMH